MSILRARFISTQHRSTQVKSAQLISTYLISAELYWVQKFFQPLMWFDQGSKYRSKSDCEAKRKRNFFREKLRSEAKRKYFSFVRSEAKRTIFQNCEKLRKIAKLRKKILSFKKSLCSFFNFNNLYKYYIYDVKSLYRLFGHLVENTGQLNKASITKKIFRKDVYFSRNRRQTHEIVKR
jgi:hypothetical protein